MIAVGDKVFVITRRLFDGDLRRHFVGEVQATTDVAMKVQGFSFVFDDVTQQFMRRADLRTRIFSLIDAGLVIHLLPDEASLDDIEYIWDDDNRRIITDQKTFSMNISEFTIIR